MSRLVPALVALVVLAASLGAAGGSGSQDAVELTADALARGVVLRESWRFREGDDPAWADPELADDTWQVAGSSFGVGEPTPRIGWLRRRLRVDESLGRRAVGFAVRQSGACELYLDGRCVAVLGTVSRDPGTEVAWNSREPVAVALEPGGEHLLAVRFSLGRGHQLTHGFRGIELRIGELDRLTERATRVLRSLVPYMTAAAGLAGALAVVHGLLFLFDRRSKEHAYFAVFAGLLALDVLCDMMTNLTPLLDLRLLWFRIGVSVLVAMLLAGIQLELVLFERRRGWPFRLLAAAGAGILVWVWTIPALREIFVLVVFMLLAVAEMLRLAVLELLRRRPSSWAVAAGLALLALSFVDFFADYFGLPSVPAGGILLAGWGAAAVSFSFFIARKGARTSHELRERLAEVEALTRERIEQERRAARERAERQVVEAEAARTARELEEARELHLAMLPEQPPQLPAVEVGFRLRTATEVGGDYYDFVSDLSGRCVIAVGDATGHGMHAGMIVAVAKSVFTTLGPTHEPTEVLAAISRRLADLRRRGATMALVLVRIDGRRLEVAGAAMPPLLVWRAGPRTVEEVSLSAPPLGSPLADGCARAMIELACGDAVLAATDGLAEVCDARGEPWGYERLTAAFAREAASDPGRVLDAMLDAAVGYAGPLGVTDDVTLVAIGARREAPSR